MINRLFTKVSYKVNLLVFVFLLISLQSIFAKENINSWTKTVPLPDKLASQSSLSIGKSIFSIDGSGSTGHSLDNAFISIVNEDGTLNEWLWGTMLPVKLIRHSNVKINNYIYVLGGFLDDIEPGGSVSDIYRTNLITPFSITDWTTEKPLPKRLSQGGAVGFGEWIYYAGGFTDREFVANSEVYFSKVNTDGSLGDWTSPPPLPSPFFGFERIENNGYLYVIGVNDTSQVFFNKINTDGTLGAWSETSALPLIANRASVVKAGSDLYVIGGNPGAAGRIFVSSFNSDGTLTEWEENSTSFPRSQCCSPAVEVGGRIYVLGGHDGGNYFDDVWMSNKVFEPTPYPTWIPVSTPTPSPMPTPTSTPKPVSKVIFIPGMGASWNSDALLNCKDSKYEGNWTMASFAKDVYKSVIDKLDDKYEVLEFYYDWRRDVRTNAEKLRGFIDANLEDEEKVNIFGHSMGGLVGRAYLETDTSSTYKYMSAGSPHEGSVLAYPAWSAGQLWEGDLLMNIGKTIAVKRCDIVLNEKMVIREHFPSFQNLLPTFSYLRNKKSQELIEVDSMNISNNWIPNEFLNNLGIVRVGTLSATGKKTLAEIEVKDPSKKDLKNGLWLDGNPSGRKHTIDGDGAVLLSSSKLNGAQNWIVGASHNGMLSNKSGLEAILSFYSDQQITVSGATELREPESALVIIGEGDIELTSQGNRTYDKQIVTIFDPNNKLIDLTFKPTKNKSILSVGKFLKNGEVLWSDYPMTGKGVRKKTINFSN